MNDLTDHGYLERKIDDADLEQKYQEERDQLASVLAKAKGGFLGEIVPTIQDEIRAYELFERTKADLEQMIRVTNADLAAQERRVVDAMIREEVDAIEYGGYKWKPNAINQPKIISAGGDEALAAERSGAVVEWLVATVPGAESKVKKQMHWAARDSMLKQTLTDDDGNVTIPAELEGVVEVYQDVKLAKRKVN